MLSEIKQKINQRGWNVYEFSDDDTIYTAAPRGPATSLEIGKQYSLFPQVNDPTNVEQVQSGCRYVSQGGRYATIAHKGRPIVLVIVAVHPAEIVTRGAIENHLSYQDFSRALETLTSVIDIN